MVARISTASRPAFGARRGLPMASVPNGDALCGVRTMERSASNALRRGGGRGRARRGRGTPALWTATRDAGQVRRAAESLATTTRSPASVGGRVRGGWNNQLGRAVGGNDLRFVRDLELAEDFDGRCEGFVVAFGAHDDGDEGFVFHQKSILPCLFTGMVE